jgi:hypothetical protein
MKTKAKKAPTKKQSARTATPRWSIGLFRNASGRLVTVYVTTEGVPMPYEKKRLNGNGKILFHAVYTGMKYSQARQRLLKDSGLKDELVEGSANGKTVAKRAQAERRTK